MADKSGPAKCRRKFLRFFRKGFHDDKYVDWERGYKWEAHEAWQAQLGRAQFRSLLDAGDHNEIALRAVRLESRTNLLFSFEKMALRDAVKAPGGAKAFSEGLFDFVYGKGSGRRRFENWVETVAALPRRQTRGSTATISATSRNRRGRSMRIFLNSPAPCHVTCATSSRAT